jgi:hypothetical protein
MNADATPRKVRTRIVTSQMALLVTYMSERGRGSSSGDEGASASDGVTGSVSVSVCAGAGLASGSGDVRAQATRGEAESWIGGARVPVAATLCGMCLC